MTRNEVYEQLTEIFRDVFDDDELTIEDSTSAEDIEEWNSLNHITLIVAVQERFQVKISSGKIFNLQNVGQFVDLILNLLDGVEPNLESTSTVSQITAESRKSRRVMMEQQRQLRQTK